MIVRILFLVIAACSLGLPALAEPVTLGSLEWPPYVGANLPDGGLTAAHVREICDRGGMTLGIAFAPWKRVLLDVYSGVTQGCFPEYRSVEREKEFLFSRPVGCSVLGFVHHRDVPFAWEQERDLSRYVIGVVAGYANSEEFDRLVAAGRIRTEVCKNDLALLRMLVARRCDAAVMDRSVFEHLKQGDTLPDNASDLVFDERILTVHTLHVCFPKTSAGFRLAERFERAAAAVQRDRVLCGALMIAP